MAQGILDNYASFDGFVILHGTDSMDFTGTALPFLLNVFDENGYGTAVLSKPIIITGSQVPMYYQGTSQGISQNDSANGLTLSFNTDAYQNMCGAIASAQYWDSGGLCLLPESSVSRQSGAQNQCQ
ncbi:asparaginase domain-containing protein [Vibrio sp. PP-XX7]